MNKFWHCPKCGWVITDLQYRTFRFDFGCARCRTSFSEFRSDIFLERKTPHTTISTIQNNPGQSTDKTNAI